MFLENFFAKSRTLTAYEMFSAEHFGFLIICSVLILTAVFLSRNLKKEGVLNATRICTIILWGFEVSKIIFNTCNGEHANSYIPLYFCSITLYCGLFSSFSKGKLKRIGDVFLVVGGIVGGVAYLISPNTTAGWHPAIHFITIQSYLHHSIMVYLGILYIVTDYIELCKRDVIYYSSTVVVMSIVAYIVNIFLGTNLMFVSDTNPGTIIDVVYNIYPKFFPIIITFIQAVPPFVVVYWGTRLYNYARKTDECSVDEMSV